MSFLITLTLITRIKHLIGWANFIEHFKEADVKKLPNNEVRVGLLHDELFWANVLLLSRVDNVPLLEDFHGKRFVLITLELNLQW